MEWYDIDDIDVRPRPKSHWYSRRRWDYLHNAATPMRFVDVDGVQYQPHSIADTDFGSTPFRWLPGLRPDDWLASYVCHDYAYRTGGLWVRAVEDCEFRFDYLAKLQVDRLLYRMVRTEGAPVAIARAIYRGVRIGTPFVHYGPSPE